MKRQAFKTLVMAISVLAVFALGSVQATVDFHLAYENLPGNGNGDTLLVNVYIDGVEGSSSPVFSATVRLRYDTTQLSFVDDFGAFTDDVAAGVMAPWGGMTLYYIPDSGQYWFAAGGVSPVTKSGKAFTARFTYLN
ncbi:MAG: hypothetical protein AB1744_10490, partial [Candidatus Zixiibacteriota bacterium]